MEEENQEKSTVVNGKLINLNAPLLSTRRTNNICTDRLFHDPKNACDQRIPFSWEQTPGKPKNAFEDYDVVNDDEDFLRPRPPPGWREYDVVNDRDDGCDADADEDDNVLDIFSLADSLETNESTTLSAEAAEEEENAAAAVEMVSPATNFMIQRFLPDAKALAAASSSAFTNIYDCNYNVLIPSNYGSNVNGCHSTGSRAVSLRQTASPCPSSKGSGGCGFDILLPWRVKPKLVCGVKSPWCKNTSN